MDFNQHLSDILHLYEFSMAIGNSLDYTGNCNHFLKLILARKNLSSCWIYRKENNQYTVTYSYPNPSKKIVLKNKNQILDTLVLGIKSKIVSVDTTIQEVSPIDIQQEGSLLIFNLHDQGILFLYSAYTDTFTPKDISQLQPIMDKFILSLEACESFSKKEDLLQRLALQNQELNDYAHIISHDLKTPLRSIDTLLNWIEEECSDSLDSISRQYLLKIHHNIEKMDALIESILTYSTIDKRKKTNYTIDLNEVMREVFKILDIPNHIIIDIVTPLPSIIADTLNMQQLFLCLLQNAINSIEQATGKIYIRVIELNHFWKFEIEDNGKGIDSKYHKKIFKVFQKLENDSMSLGMGLPIAQKIVNHYGGNMSLTSNVNRGSIFSFTLKNNDMNLQPNLEYVNELSGGDALFKQKLIGIIKKEFPEEKEIFLHNYKSSELNKAAENVHKLKHKIGMLGLDDGYQIAIDFENELLAGKTSLFQKFMLILDTIDEFIHPL